MSGPGFMVTVDDDRLRRAFAQAPETAQRRLGQLVEGAAIAVQREMRIRANVGVTGDLRRSVRYSYSATNLRAVITPNVDYASDVEYGTPPHAVSAAPGTPLARWARQKGLNPYAVANSIKRRGTRKHPFVGPTYDVMKPRVEADLAHGITRLAKDLNE